MQWNTTGTWITAQNGPDVITMSRTEDSWQKELVSDGSD